METSRDSTIAVFVPLFCQVCCYKILIVPGETWLRGSLAECVGSWNELGERRV